MPTPTAADLNAKGIEFQSRGDFEGARLHYLAALKLDPNCVPAMANLAVMMGECEKLDAAAALARKLVVLRPQVGNFWNLLGNFETRLDHHDAAQRAFNEAVKLSPELSTIHHNRALCYLRQREYKSALLSFAQAERLGSTGLGIQNDEAHALLALGDLKAALAVYEARWETLTHLPPWDFHVPEWKGEDLVGKRIMIHGEQGLGDTIMTLRFFRNLPGIDVVLAVPESLKRLVDAQCWNVDVVAIEKLDADVMRGLDFQSPMYSAMRWLGVTREAISSEPYLAASGMDQQKTLGPGFHVGLCWASGRRGTDMDQRRREVDLRLFASLFDDPETVVWSLQKGTNEEDIENLGFEGLIRDETGSFNDWLDTFAFVAGLDLVLTVDTAIAHLAGAMGKPTVMLAQYTNCWRWWDIESGTGRPWYKNMSIFRQETPMSWGSAVEKAIVGVKGIRALVQHVRRAA